MTDSNSQLEAIAERVSSLYSLPAVAMEVVRLTDQPDVDAQALTRCIERDPALVAKVLRVVNSSLFGLSHRVSNLNQALAMLGTSPLKLLVLGFSLPDQLVAHAKKDQLAWYWTTSLTRAVAARQLSQSLWNKSGDEAFLAGLLQDIGLLALLRELDDAFAQFLGRVIAERRDLTLAEAEALGFDHRHLTVSMLRRWNLPEDLVEAIGMRGPPLRLARREGPAAEIARVLHLADLLAQLVGQRRISVLPDLLEAGQLFCELNKPKLFEVVGELQPKVDQLAEVLSLDLPDGRDYEQVLLEAHRQLTEVAESVTLPLLAMGAVDEPCDNLLAETESLGAAIQEFLDGGSGPTQGPEAIADTSPDWSASHAPHQRTTGEAESATKTAPVSASDVLAACIMSAARGCRMRRSELSLMLVEIDGHDFLTADVRDRFARLLVQACSAEIPANAELVRMSAGQRAIVLPDFERRQAVALANNVVSRLVTSMRQNAEGDPATVATISAGVATATSIFKNFTAASLLEGAHRSLSAARASGGSAVKSIEVL